MNYLFAPLEGITGWNYRRTHHEFFPGIAAYYTPFVVATHTNNLKTREKRDILPQNNAGVPTVPQILTNRADEFLFCAQYLSDLGYHEVNLNLGCPVGTVTAKKKGSGMLTVPDVLDRFLDQIYNGAAHIPVRHPDGSAGTLQISIKTRLGWENPEEFAGLLHIYAQYPIALLIVHARTRRELYHGQPELETFAAAYEELTGSSSHPGKGLPSDTGPNAAPAPVFSSSGRHIPLCYNGSICTASDIEYIEHRFPELHSIMIGRGLIADPALVTRRTECSHPAFRESAAEDPSGCAFQLPPAPAEDAAAAKGLLRQFHDTLYLRYGEQFPDDRIRIGVMKEIWQYMGKSFLSPNGSLQYQKAILKAKNRAEYDAAVRILFSNCRVCEPENGITVRRMH